MSAEVGCALYVLFGVIGVISNSILLFTTIRTTSLRAPCNILIGTCALFDVIHQLGIFPVATVIYRGATMPCWTCSVILFVPEMGCAAGSFAVLSIGLDRLMSVLAPNRYQQTNKRTYLTVHFFTIFWFCAFNAFLMLYFYREHPVICQIPDAFHDAAVSFWAGAIGAVDVIAALVYALTWSMIKSRADLLEEGSVRRIFSIIILVTTFDVVGWATSQLIVAAMFALELPDYIRLSVICFAGIPVNHFRQDECVLFQEIVMLSLTDKLNLGVIWTLATFAIVTNILLIATIILKFVRRKYTEVVVFDDRTPKYLRTYSVFLLNNAFVDLATAIASSLAVVRIVENREERTVIFVYLGPCQYISKDLCRICQALHVHLVQHSTVILLLSFAYRLNILGRSPTPNSSRSRIWLICVTSLLMIVPLIACYCIMQTKASEEELRSFHLEGFFATSYDILDTRAMIVDGFAVILSPIVLTTIFVVRRKLITRIEQAKIMDRRHHESIARALTYQCLLPCGVAIGASFWLADVVGVYSSQFSERIIMVMFSIFRWPHLSLTSLCYLLIELSSVAYE